MTPEEHQGRREAAGELWRELVRRTADKGGCVLSRSFTLAQGLLGQVVTVTIDRPIGSRHPKHGYIYPVNYGYVSGVIAPDGEELDAYLLGVEQPVESATGIVRAVVHRRDDDDDKLVVIPDGLTLDDAEIKAAVDFQEGFFGSEIVRRVTGDG